MIKKLDDLQGMQDPVILERTTAKINEIIRVLNSGLSDGWTKAEKPKKTKPKVKHSPSEGYGE